MKSYISRKLPQETRTTDSSFDERSMFTAVLCDAPERAVAYYRDAHSIRRAQDPLARGRLSVRFRGGACGRGPRHALGRVHRSMRAIGTGVRACDRTHDGAEVR